MLAKIADSALTASDAARLHLKPMTSAPPELHISGAGFTIPYYSITGQRNGFYRYRYLEPIRTTGGKLLRYSQQSGKSPQPYFPPFVPWLKYLAAAQGEARKLLITEGELKACCAAKLQFPAIGLGGVWNFKSRSEALVSGLAEIDWTNAVVHIVYDSDAITNYQVIQAENALARELLALGAHIYIVRLPQLVPGKKIGLDDYLVTKGAEEFQALLDTTQPWQAGRQLHELNEEVVFVHDPGAVLEVETGQRMSAPIFARSVYANRVWDEVVYGPKGKPKIVKKSAAVEWIRWPGRAEVRRTTYQPGAARILETQEFNCWRGWGCEPVKGEVSLWHSFMDYFFLDADPGDRHWFEQWLAYPLQYPGTKLFQAVVVHSLAQGSGKTLAAYSMKRIYGANFSEIDENQLLGQFNAWAENKQFVMGDEIAGGDKRAFSDRLKAVITRETLRINAKYVPEYEVPDCVNYYFTSNHPDSFYLEDEDRRFFIHELRCGPLPLDFAAAYDAWYLSAVGAGALFYYLLQVNLSGFNPRGPARQNAAKREMIALGRSDIGAWVAQLRENPEQVLKLGDAPPLLNRFMTTDELFRFYDPLGKAKLTRPGLSRELKRGGFRQVNKGEPVRTAQGTVRLWAVCGDRKEAETMKLVQVAAIRDREQKVADQLLAKRREKF